MANYFNDSPIERTEDDRYGVVPFAGAIARAVAEIRDPIGTTIAINGPWGSGKSSVVNLVRSALEQARHETLEVVDFRCWWYRGEEAIALSFLQTLNATLRSSLGDKLKDAIPAIGRQLLQAGPVIGAAASMSNPGLGAVLSGGMSFAKRFFPEKDSLEKTFKKVAKALEGQSKRFLIIVDDIDRLSPDEALAIFRLVKSVGRLPNVMYLLVFDRALADAAVKQRFPSEGAHFLEKIIQASFEVPHPTSTDLNNALLAAFGKLCGDLPDEQATRFMNVFYDIVAPHLVTPRHVSRLINAVSVTWPAIAGEINVADFLALETLRLYEPALHTAIRKHKDVATGQKAPQDGQRRNAERFVPFVGHLDAVARAQAEIAVQRLFPALEPVEYGPGFAQGWAIERRVCISAFFDSYFRLSLSDEAIPAASLQGFLARAGDRAFVRETLLAASETLRASGKSLVPVWLDQLTTHARQVPAADVQALLSALFAVADAINRTEDDERGFGVVGTPLRLHWLTRRLTEERLSVAERSRLLSAAAEHASPEWLVDFTSSVLGQHEPREGRELHPDDWLMTAEDAAHLRVRAVDTIQALAASGGLMRSKQLTVLLYRWIDFSDDAGADAHAWIDDTLRDEDGVMVMAHHLLGEAWVASMGFVGLGDRVSQRVDRVAIGEDFRLFDSAPFRAALERIARERRRTDADVALAERFLAAWRNSERPQRRQPES